MTESKWSMLELFRNRLRLMPRGPQGCFLELIVGVDRPLNREAQQQLVADIAERLEPALQKDPAVLRFLALKTKCEKIQGDKQTAELNARKWQAEKDLLVHAAYAPDQGEKLRSIETQIALHQRNSTALNGLLGQVETQLATARQEAERVLRVHLDREACAALTRYQAHREQLLADFCAVNADRLDELAAAIESVTQASLGRDFLKFEFLRRLDAIALPEGAAEGVQPLPPPPAPPAEPPTTLLVPGASISLPAALAPGPITFRSEPSPEPTAPTSEPPAEPAAQMMEDEPRGKVKRRATAKAE